MGRITLPDNQMHIESSVTRFQPERSLDTVTRTIDHDEQENRRLQKPKTPMARAHHGSRALKKVKRQAGTWCLCTAGNRRGQREDRTPNWLIAYEHA